MSSDRIASSEVPRAGFRIVGLGASAGGLEAFEQFFRRMAVDSGMAFVLVQHLDPNHASLLAGLVQRSTTMPVIEAQDQMVVEPNHVYVIPPNCSMGIAQGALQLNPPLAPRGQRLPIDIFLSSLAADMGDKAVGIILSGNGEDGVQGLRAIFSEGGLCLAQEPDTAQFDGMPKSAIRAGCVHQVCTIDQLPQAIQSGANVASLRRAQPLPTLSTAELSNILLLLRTGTGHDFSLYKKSTIARRIERRMALHRIDRAEAYAEFIRQHTAEAPLLFKELLINVTRFFRDKEAFEALQHDVLPDMLEGRPIDDVLRVWIAGCASGEEAYTVAILLREVMDALHQNVRFQIYSTDLDDDAIATARRGLYPLSIAQDVSPERLSRYFIHEGAGYRINKEIREMVVFAVQSVIKDPPFTKLDLLVCRNLFIYFELEQQNRLIPTFHYALKPGGVLMLSPSEGIGDHVNLFKPINRKWKLYRAQALTPSRRAVLINEIASPSLRTLVGAPEPARQGKLTARPDIVELTKRLLLQVFVPAAVVTDLQGNVLYVHGDAAQFLQPAPGHTTLNIIEMAQNGLQVALREAVQRAAIEGLPTLRQRLTQSVNGVSQSFDLCVRLMPDMNAKSKVLLISFHEQPDAPKTKSRSKTKGHAPTDAMRVEDMALEVACAQAGMSSLREAQQSVNEELKSANEELQSANEELQSTNEELETSKEELQSVNEELITVNVELQSRIEQMSSMQDDMKNLLENIRIGTIFLDLKLHIRRFTRDAVKVYRLAATDVGRALGDIRSEILGEDLLIDAQKVLNSLETVEREVCTANGTWYLARIQPYRTVNNVVDGVVLTFTDVTERVQALTASKARHLAEAIVDAVPSPLVVLDDALNVISANQAYYKAYPSAPKQTVGQYFFDIGGRRWDGPALRELLETTLPRERSFERRPVTYSVPDQAARSFLFSAHYVADDDGGALLLLSID
ncbi:MAG: chemotaxis protein CheB [Aquabacterium sp.]|nr:chemotaxis protein CheB [Aquabacterium sp.]